jgi:hypothetical protein
VTGPKLDGDWLSKDLGIILVLTSASSKNLPIA